MPASPKHDKHILRRVLWGVLAVVVVYALFALVPYMTAQEASGAIADAQYSEENVNRAKVLGTGAEALDARLTLIENAQRSIRIASYLYATDKSGDNIAAALLAAADRGVKIELLVDGLIGSINFGTDILPYALGSHPNITLKYYDPIDLANPQGLNASFHEKYFIVDDEWLILGGRNVSDEFLTDPDDPKYNVDLDVMLHKERMDARDAVTLVTDYFDALWASDLCAAQFESVPASRAAAVETKRAALAELLPTLRATRNLTPVVPASDMVAVERAAFLANPVNAGVKQPTLWKQLCTLMGGAQERLWIVTPYLVMNDVMRQDLTALAKPTEAKLLLNGRNTGNNIIASADYVFQKGAAGTLGMPVYEYQGDASMHTKSILIDDDLSVFGSFNFDIRSEQIDTEVMLAVWSDALNDQLESYMTPLFADSLNTFDSGDPINADVTPSEGSFGKTLIVYVLSPFVWLFRYLA